MENRRRCPICNTKGKKIFCGKIMKKYMIQYFQCPKCAFVFTEKPYWLDESYLDSITCIDTGIMERNIANVLATNILIKRYFSCNKVFLDYGGGYGIFTRMMRDIGFNWLWQDKYSKNYLARGFEYKGNEKLELVTAFELFEHFEDPMHELKYIFSITDTLLFSTLVYDKERKYKRFNSWWYYVPITGQHISFYSEITLSYIAKEVGVDYYKINDGLHLFTKRKISKLSLKLLFNENFAWILQGLYYYKAKKNSLSVKDMNTFIKK